MTDRFFVSSCVVAGVMAVGLSVPVAAQTPSPVAAKTSSAKSTASARPWTLPRTPDGQPDLQGYWTNPNYTPLERPAKFIDKEFFTDKEEAEFYKAAVDYSYEFTFQNSAETPVYDATVYALDRWQIGARPNRRTSLIVNPPNGRIPPRTPEGEARAAAMRRRETFDGPEDLPMGTRCMGGSPNMLGSGYRSQYLIVQSAGQVVITYEDMGNVRIIPLDGRPHLPQGRLSRLMGDSRGHWEGDTLVVETTNVSNKDNFMGSSTGLRVVERFARTAADTLVYTFTADDPATWTKTWTAEVPMMQIEGPIFEYACHEGNNGLVNILEGARAQEKAAAETLKKGSK
jgi:hypothetical protein